MPARGGSGQPLDFSNLSIEAASQGWLEEVKLSTRATERRELAERVIQNENPRPASPQTGETRGTLVSVMRERLVRPPPKDAVESAISLT